jgi:nicotinate-nucleotide adenylyltransferase
MQHRIPERDAGQLAAMTPPAWIFLTGMKSPLSSTRLRNPDGSWKT